jgi:uncharacterized protein YjbI with pentapeptide repeats
VPLRRVLRVVVAPRQRVLRCRFERCRFAEARFEGCKAVGSSSSQGSYAGLTVSGGDWSFTSFAREDLRGSSGRRGCARPTSPTHGLRACPRGCDLSGALWQGADLRRADLRGNVLTSLDPAGMRLRGARIDEAGAVALARALGLDVD